MNRLLITDEISDVWLQTQVWDIIKISSETLEETFKRVYFEKQDTQIALNLITTYENKLR